MGAIFSSLNYRLTRGFRVARQAFERASFRPLRLDEFDRHVCDSLAKTGAVVTSVDELTRAGYAGVERILEYGAKLFEEADRAEKDGAKVRVSAEDAGHKDYIQQVPADRIMGVPESILWGLQERFLGIVENYIGLPSAYRGLAARKDIANGIQGNTRIWHVDGEDSRILKIIVYLNDVETAEDGPFEFIPRSVLPPNTSVPIFNGSRSRDEDIDALAPVETYVLCTGKVGTVLFADPCSIWHRGSVGKRRDRKALFYAFNSRYPLNPQFCAPLFDRDQFLRKVQLTPRQNAFIDS